MRRSAYALLVGTLVLTTLRLEEPPTSTAGDQAQATLVAAVRTHGTPASPPVALLALTIALAAIVAWRALVPAAPPLTWASAPMPIRRRGPPSFQS